MDEPTVIVSVDVVEVGLGEKEAVTPAGFPESDKATVPVNPFNGVTVTVELPESPCCIVSELGDAATEKSDGRTAGVVADAVFDGKLVPNALIAETL